MCLKGPRGVQTGIQLLRKFSCCPNTTLDTFRHLNPTPAVLQTEGVSERRAGFAATFGGDEEREEVSESAAALAGLLDPN